MVDNKDDILVRQFFEDNKVILPNDGFSRRVMRRLPRREQRLNRVWTVVCVAAGVAMAASIGVHDSLSAIVGRLSAVMSAHASLADEPYMLWLLLLSVIFAGGYKAVAGE